MKEDISGLIESAIAGDQQSMDELIRRVQPRIRAYILRSTLNEDLTEDIVQETMLQLITSLKTLTNITRFWPWLYKIAANKKISHFRKTKNHPAMHFSSMEPHLLESAMEDEYSDDVTEKPGLQELHKLIMATMQKLSGTERSILSLRCFEDMPYDQIAEINDCTQSTARVQFLRARKKLKSSLLRQGLSGKAILPSLVLFGKLTADKTLAPSVTSASVTLNTGMTTVQVAIATVKAGVVQYTTATAAAAAVVVLAHLGWAQMHPHPYPDREDVQSVHYTVQGVGELDESNLEEVMRPNNRSRKGDVDEGPYYSKGAFEQYLQFPEGPDGPVLVRMQRWELDKVTHQKGGKQCGWLQNGRANYYHAIGFADGSTRIYITNDPIGMLILPTDSPEMVDFLMAHSNNIDRIRYTRDQKTGLITTKHDNRVPEVKDYQTEYAYNSLTEADFAPFWSKNAAVYDQRDAMHYRGWTLFSFEGHLGEMEIHGKGKLPFTYDAWKDNKPWLDIHLGDSIHIMDTEKGACLTDITTGKVTSYPAGTFFTGIGRPWTGLRAYDTLRRDAATERIPFEAERIGETATVNLSRQLGNSTYSVNYTIDMLTDVITQIDLTEDGENPVAGQLTFTYAQDDLADWQRRFTEPTVPTEKPTDRQFAKHHWLLDLLEKRSGNQQAVLAAQ